MNLTIYGWGTSRPSPAHRSSHAYRDRRHSLQTLSNSTDMPYDLALQSGKLWVSYDAGGAGTGAIGEIDLAAARPAFTPAALPGPTWYWPPDLAADPSDDGFLVGASTDLDPAPVGDLQRRGQDPGDARAHWPAVHF